MGLFKDNQQIIAEVKSVQKMKVTKLYKFRFTVNKMYCTIWYKIQVWHKIIAICLNKLFQIWSWHKNFLRLLYNFVYVYTTNSRRVPSKLILRFQMIYNIWGLLKDAIGKKETNIICVSKVKGQLWCICFEVHTCHKWIYYCSYIMFINKQWYNIYLGVLDLSNDTSFVMIRL